MNRKKNVWIIVGLITICVLAVSAVAASSSQIDFLFNQMSDELNTEKDVSDSEVVAEVGDRVITVKDFRKYRENLLFMARYSGHEIKTSHVDKLNEMIKRELTIQHAIQRGITIDAEELDRNIQEQREVLEHTDSQEIRDVLQNLIKMSGLSAEEYWQSAETIQQYKEWFLIGKLADEMLSQGEIDEPHEFDDFQDALLEDLEHSITIREDILQRID